MTKAEAARARADHDNAWRQWISDSAVETVDTALSHVQAVVEEQVAAYGTFPAFLVTGGKDGECDNYADACSGRGGGGGPRGRR